MMSRGRRRIIQAVRDIRGHRREEWEGEDT